jgi:6-phospho-beta-glucosidase
VAGGGPRGLDDRVAVRITLVGGGGFRTPSVLDALALVSPVVSMEPVVLHDVDAGRLERIAHVIEGANRARGGGLDVRTTADLDEALEGADVVFVAIRVGGLEARIVDEAVPLELGVLGQETVGPGGVAFALRTVPEVVRIAEAVGERSAGAWFVNLTNPVGVVTEAARGVLGSKAVGICDSPTALWRNAAAALGRTPAMLRPGYAGLNHLGWLSALWEGDRDVLPTLIGGDRLERVHEARLAGIATVRERGVIPNEYLTYYRERDDVIRSFRRDGSRAEILAAQQARFSDAAPSDPAAALSAWRTARDERHGTYMAEVPDTGGPGSAMADDGDYGYGDVAAAFVRAVANETADRLILGVRNVRTLPWLDDEATVELPCDVGADGPRPQAQRPLPPPERELMERVREAERATATAVATPSRRALVEALAAHPVVPSRELAERIANGYLERHDWMRERYA